MVTQITNLNMIPGTVKPVIHVSQYDVGLRTLQFYLYSGSAVANIPADAAVTIEGLKPDGNVFSYACEYETNLVTCDLTQQMTIVEGDVLAEIKITKNGEVIGSANFIIRVELSPYDSGTQSESQMTGIQAIIKEEASAAIADAAQSASNAADSATSASNSAAAAANSAITAETSATAAAALVGIIIPMFVVDYTTGELMYTDYTMLDSYVTFAINQTSGNLDYTITT